MNTRPTFTDERGREFIEDDDGVAIYLDSVPPAATTKEGQLEWPVIRRVSEVERERVEWIWRNYIPAGKLVIIDGDPGVGKSTFSHDLAARITTASPMPTGERPDRPRGVVFLSAEDGVADTIRPRLESAGADLERVVVFTEVDSIGGPRPPSIPADLGYIEQAANDVDAAIIFVDPLMAFLAGSVDSHRDQDVRRVLHLLAAMAERTGAAVGALRHLSKGGGANAVYRGGGSIGIIGQARVGLLVGRDPEDEGLRVLAVTKSNLGPEASSLSFRLLGDAEYEVARIAWEGAVSTKANDLLGTGPLNPDDANALQHAKAVVDDILIDGPVLAREAKNLARDAGVSPRTLDRAKNELGVESEKRGFGKEGAWWWVPKNAKEPLRTSVESVASIDESGVLSDAFPGAEEVW